MWSSRFNYLEHYMTTYKLVLRMLAASVVVMPVAAREHDSDERNIAEDGVENLMPGYEKPLTADSMPESLSVCLRVGSPLEACNSVKKCEMLTVCNCC